MKNTLSSAVAPASIKHVLRTTTTLAVALGVMNAALGQDPGSILPGNGPEPAVQTTFYGPSGLIHVPTAYTVGRFDAKVGAAFEAERQAVVGNFGIYRDIEVGGGWIERNGRDGKPIANAKVRIQAANFRNVDIGIGVIDAFDAVDQTVFVVGSADLVPPPVKDNVFGQGVGVKVHVGYGSGVFNQHLIGGAELRFSTDLSLIGEYDGDMANFAVRFSRDQRFSVQSGIANHRLFFGFSGGIRF